MIYTPQKMGRPQEPNKTAVWKMIFSNRSWEGGQENSFHDVPRGLWYQHIWHHMARSLWWVQSYFSFDSWSDTESSASSRGLRPTILCRCCNQLLLQITRRRPKYDMACPRKCLSGSCESSQVQEPPNWWWFMIHILNLFLFFPRKMSFVVTDDQRLQAVLETPVPRALLYPCAWGNPSSRESRTLHWHPLASF